MIEACILGAIAIIPVLYEPGSETLYQIPKAVVLQSLACLLLGACCARWMLKIRSPGKMTGNGQRWLSLPFLPCLGLAVLSLISTLLSVDPATSWNGLYDWKQGSLNLCALILLFLAVAETLRSEEQRERLLTTLLVASLPVSIYAILQRHQVSVTAGRVYSTLGSPVFLGDYLAPLVLLTFWRIARQFRASSGKKSEAVGAFFYVLLAALQMYAFLLTDSRGSQLSLIGGLFLWVILTFNFNWRRLLAGGLAVLTVLLVCLAATQNGSLSPVKLLTRLDQSSPGHEGNIAYRTGLWQAAADVAVSPEPIRYPDGSNDRWRLLRPLIGFGLNTQPFVLLQHLREKNRSPEDVVYYVHNLAWEKWIETGALGLLAFVAVPVFLFFLALRRLGMIASRKDTRGFWMALAAGGLGGAAVLMPWGGLAFAGVGLQFGCFTGLVLFVLVKRAQGNSLRRTGRVDRADAAEVWLNKEAVGGGTERHTQGAYARMRTSPSGFMVVVLCVITICLLCTGTEPPTIATLMNYWVLLGLLSSLVKSESKETSSAIGESSQATSAGGEAETGGSRQTVGGQAGWRPVLAPAFVASLVLVTVLQDFIWLCPFQQLSTLALLRTSLLTIQAERGYDGLIWLLILPVWLGASWLMATDRGGNDGNLPKWRLFGRVAVVSGVVGSLFAVVRAWQMAGIGPFPDTLAGAGLVLQKAAGYELAFPWYLLVTGVLLLAGGFLLSQTRFSIRGIGSGRGFLAFLTGSSLAALAAAFLGGARNVQADVSCHFAELLQTQGMRQSSLEVYQRAINLNPGAFFYRWELAKALGELAGAAPDYESFVRWNIERESTLLAGQEDLLVGRNLILLGTSYLEWAGGVHPESQVRNLALRASQAFHRAIPFDPQNAAVWMECAMADSGFLSQTEKGAGEKGQALKLAVRQGREILGGYYLAAASAEPCVSVRILDAAAAIEFYREVIRDPNSGKRQAFFCQISTARAYLVLRNFSRALEVWRESLAQAPADEIWRSEEFQAQFYFAQNDQTQALQHVESAISLAPPSEIKNLAALRNTIGAGAAK